MLGSGQLVHDAFFYDDDEDFVAGIGSILYAGLAQGHACVAATTNHNIGLLRTALGAAADRVAFIDRDEWYRRPARTVSGWKRLLDEALGTGHTYLHIIGEVRFGEPPEHTTWSRYESSLNLSFAAAPCWITCPYHTRTLPAGIIADARRTHPTLAGALAYSGSPRTISPEYTSPEVYLNTVPEPLPEVIGAPAVQLVVDCSLVEIRRTVRSIVVAHGWLAADRLDDLMLALSEIVANSLRYGRGKRTLSIWPVERPLRGVVCEVGDEGDGPADPLLGYRPPDDSSVTGRGMWIAQQLCDAMAVDASRGGTRVRFTVGSPV